MKKITALLLAAALIAAAACVGAFAVLKPLGDANGDGEVDNKDVVTLFRFLSGSDISCDEEVCDLNGDGTADNKDVVLLFRFLSSGQEPEIIETEETPEIDLEGREVVVLINGTLESANEIFGDESSESPLDRAVYERASKVRKSGNCILSCVTYQNAAEDLKKDRKSGLHEYDLTLLNANEICSLAMEDCLADLNKVPYLDLEKDCWDTDLISSFTVADKLFCITGDLSVTAMGNTYLLAFNKTVLAKYDAETPYSMVRNGIFTLDQLYVEAYMMYQDINENYGVDSYDEFGFGAGISSIAPLFFGMGGKLTEFDVKGSPTLNISDRTIEGVQKLGSVYNEGMVLADADDVVRAAFAEGRLAFYPTSAAELAALIKETGNDYGILPLPKYDAEQVSYFSTVSQETLLYAVPYNADGYEISGSVLELLCRFSDKIIPTYCGILAQTEDDAEMLELVLKSRRWDLLYHGLYPELDEEIIEAYENNNLELFMFMSQFKANQLLSNYENKIKSNVS